MNLDKFNFKGKTVLITGNTGFKGSWLTIWLKFLGANIVGYSNNVFTNPSFYKIAKLKNIVNQHYGDISNYNKINNLLHRYKPAYVFHLAAQPIVSESYKDPLKNFRTNVLGTINILNALLNYNKKIIVILISSDKVYKNFESLEGYKETDILGGDDPYSASKAMAELSINSYFQSFLKNKKNIRLGVCRAGNVIGGGDWATNRIVPDCVRSWSRSKQVFIRNPNSTRPWQHVLEPISGYLTLARDLNSNKKLNGESFNFGPQSNDSFKVINLINEMSLYWKNKKWVDSSKKRKLFKESRFLELNCAKAKKTLKWSPTLNFNQTAKFTIDWYKTFYTSDKFNAYNYSLMQINDYISIFKSKK